MAKTKKRGAKGRRTSRRRVGAIDSGVMSTAALIGGMVLGKVLNNVATKPSATTGKPLLEPKLASGVLLVAGFLGTRMLRNPTVKMVSAGASGMNGVLLLQNLGAIKGLPSMTMVSGQLPASSMVSGNQRAPMNSVSARTLAVNEC